MSGTPVFVITDMGLAVASTANPEGPFIHITTFQIGSAFGYTPTRSDTGLNGNLLFSGTPTSYDNIGDNTIDILCQIPPDAGPFDFGEVGLFLDGGVMFAKAVFDTPQSKFSSLGTNVISSYSLHCTLKLQQSTAVFQIDTISGPPAVLDIFQWSDVFPPGVSANPDVPLYLVKELSFHGDSSLLQNTSDSEWTLGSTSYSLYEPSGALSGQQFTFPVANSSTSWVEVLASYCHPLDLTVPNRTFVIQTADGFYRSVSSVIVSGANYRFNLNVSNDGTYNNSPLLNAPPVSSQIRIYRDDVIGGNIFYSQIIDPPPPAQPGQGLYASSPGVIAAQGLLHSPGNNTGRTLTAADDLNNLSLLSGMYTTFLSQSGQPANCPLNSVEAHIWVHNYGGGSDITQFFIPVGSGNGTAGTGDGGATMYWRSYDAGIWYPWFPFYVVGKAAPGGGIPWTNANLQPLTVNGIGYNAFIVLNNNSSQSQPEGTIVALPGRPGTWLSSGNASAAADDWCVWTRIA